VTVKNTEINIIFPETKTFNLDIRATTANGYCINVEMQKARPAHFADRVVLQHSAFTVLSKYEWDQGFEELPPNPTDKDRAERESRRYEIPPTYTIWVCDFKVARQDSYRGVWSVRNEKGLTLNDKVMYILYDLTQFTKSLDEIQTDEDRWLYLLKHAGSAENLPDFNDDVIAKAINRLLVNKASDKLLKEQADDMVFTEEQSDRMALARVRARAIVLAEGEQKKAREMARALKTMDVPIEKIVAASGLTQAEVEAL
jgi:predicted transposase/invertase (TIGR01784 family)